MCREKAGGQDEMRMLRAMYAEGEERLRQAGIEEAGLDAWYLLEFVTGVDKAHYYMNPDRRMEQSVAQEYEKVVKLRTEHIPLQHITGVQEFMGLEFQVSGDVLIPRQDTEVLVEEALKLLEQEKVPKEKETVRMLDLCTGSGCILISILYYAAKEKIQIQGTGADISEAALRIAESADLRRKSGCMIRCLHWMGKKMVCSSTERSLKKAEHICRRMESSSLRLDMTREKRFRS
mgnify:CR=1 FL=1